MSSNNTNHPLEVYNYLSKYEHDKKEFLQFHQAIVLRYFKKFGTRGLLIFHGTGSGKTLMSLSVANEFRDSHTPVVLAPKSTQDNFRKDLKKLGSDMTLNFVSLNAGNMIKQLGEVGKSEKDKRLEKKIDTKVSLNKKFIIVDEAQNLFNGIVNGSKNATEFYRLCLKARDVKIMFLSATPITNDVFEIMPIYNMLAGYQLLPEHYTDFVNIFVDGTTIKNRDKLKNRIFGYTTYVGDLHNPNLSIDINKTIKRENFPDQLPIIVEKIPMSPEQFSSYSHARDKERINVSSGPVRHKPLQKPKDSSGSVYRVYTRQLSNFLYDTPGSISGKIKNLKINSPKMELIFKNISKHKGLVVVYSNFVKNGLNVFAEVLKSNGWTPYNKYEQRYDTTFISITGDVPEKDRVHMIDKFNSKNNKSGQYIKLMLLSPTGAEGLDLKNVMSIHIMDPYWNYGRIQQIIARAIRYKSHDDYPKPERKVQPYIYLSDYPKNYDSTGKELTTDIELFTKSLRRKDMIDDIYYLMIESSFDCMLQYKGNKKIDCLMCSPTNEKLFYKDIHKDIAMRNRCIKKQEVEVSVKDITVNEKEYMYSIDGDYDTITVYEFNPGLDSYVEVDMDHEDYNDIIDAIQSGNK